MGVKHMPPLARALLPPNSVLPGRPPWSLRQTHLASEAIQLSLSMRWAVLILSLTLTLLSPRGWPGLGISFLIAIGYTVALTLSARLVRLPAPWLTAVIDVALVTSAIIFRGAPAGLAGRPNVGRTPTPRRQAGVGGVVNGRRAPHSVPRLPVVTAVAVQGGARLFIDSRLFC